MRSLTKQLLNSAFRTSTICRPASKPVSSQAQLDINYKPVIDSDVFRPSNIWTRPLKPVPSQKTLNTDYYKDGNKSLQEIDLDVYNLLKLEQNRQRDGLELIASENFASQAVMEAVGSSFCNKTSEGYPGARYYGGNQYIDELELLCIDRALQLFNLDPNEWGCNVQSYSGVQANISAYPLFLNPGDRFMGLHLTHGGHLSHGFYTNKKPINQSARYFNSLPYTVDKDTGYVDYDDLERTAQRFCPKLIIAGASAYPRDWDYKKFRNICDNIGAKLLVDMAHTSALVSCGLMNNPFEYADIVTATTHKLLRSTRAALIYTKKEYINELNHCVFPLHQGTPHNHVIAGIAVALKEALCDEFKEYCTQMVLNSKKLAESLMSLNQKIVTNGTDNHIVLIDLRPHNIGGNKIEYSCEIANITVNKNSVNGDVSAVNPGGIRIGTPALTTRGFKENSMKDVAKYLVECIEISKEIDFELMKINGKASKLNEFKIAAQNNDKLKELGKKVKQYAQAFSMPGKIFK